MVKLVEVEDSLVVDAAAYRLRVPFGRPVAWLDDLNGEPWCELRMLAQLDTLEGVDETVGVAEPETSDRDRGLAITWRQSSTHWTEKRLTLACTDDELVLRVDVRGRGRLTNVDLLSGGASLPGSAAARFRSGARFATLFSPNPGHPGRVVTPASEGTTIGVSGGSEPGRGQWFFTPAPFCYAVSRAAITDPVTPPDGPWLSLGLVATPGTMTFSSFDYVAGDAAFALRLVYDGHTRVEGDFAAPELLIRPGSPDPYAALRAYRATLVSRGLARARMPPATPPWWLEPMFCGWGAQCHVARAGGGGLAAAASYSRQALYDEWLANLEANGVVPGTIVIDDRWQADYARGEPDRERWPDLRGWIARRHERRQRVLLWWKAWDPGSLPAGLCVTSAAGERIALDPDAPAAREAVARAVRSMLAEDGLGADGLKIDFTARTPTGVTLRHAGPNWGVELLRRLLETVHEAAKASNPEALLVGHTPNPAVDMYVDMIRLNDMLRLDDPPPYPPIVPQMRYRAGVVAAASPDHPIDTDDWCVPDLDNWRSWTAVQSRFGVPALYYATHVDLTGEPFEAADYELVRRTWADYRKTHGLRGPPLDAVR